MKEQNKSPIISAIFYILSFLTIIWTVEIINLSLEHQLCQYGILPREKSGLPGIFLSPFLHYGVSHVLMNTTPLMLLAAMVIIRDSKKFLKVSIFIMLFGGIGVWILGRNAYHVGASGLIFGYFGFLVAKGWYEKSIGSIFIATIAIVLYGGIIWGLLPVSPYISWEGHLFGLIAGIVAARIFK